MDVFDPADNTMVCVYGPPEYFENGETQPDENGTVIEKQSFLSRLIGLLKKLFEAIKGLFVK